ncbi:CWF19-like protein 2 [Perognathus longimembris pacificus]|uniref:CWF19-like protein 2 n=1 Tax=Perognathus longimembris pacificus TaxID=214514 RepID=UPI002018B72C|nr:CWF19-like protein 2 [Perognathus longimembris pacificus]
MAASGVRFESAKSIEDRKEQLRSARAEVLRQAKASFEKEEKRKELKRLRGEDTWMLPDVNERIEQFSEEHSVKKKKKKEKHSKKAKKEKKKKSKKQKYEKNESTDSSSSSEDEWVEAVPSQPPGKEKAWKVKGEKSEKEEDSQVIQRDEWMTVDFMSVKTVSSASLKAEKETIRKIEQEKTEALERSKLLERELNPYWKDGGTGLPSEDCGVSSVTKASGIEDGGLSWLRKSYQRMKEQAEKENRDFEDIVSERYGSMEIFQSKLEEAEKIAFKKEDYRRDGWRKPAYLDETQNNKESRKSDLVKSSNSSRDRYGTTGNRNNEDRFYADEKSKRSGSLETCTRESSPRHSQEFSSRNSRPKFLRPCDDDQPPFHCKVRSFEPSASSLALVAQGSLRRGFRKPMENSDENSEKTPWHCPERREGDKKCIDPKPLETRGSGGSRHSPRDGREELQIESVRDAPSQREHLQHMKSTLESAEGESTHILTVDEKNKLGAKIIKAEMMGNMELAERLKAQLEKANKFNETVTQMPSKKPGSENEEQQEVLLVRSDESGRVWPVAAPGGPLAARTGKGKKQKVSTHEGKERVRYFQDDDHLSLNDLVRNEKMGTAENQNRLFMRMASKFMGKTDGDSYTLDDMFVSKAAEGGRFGEEENQRKRAIAEHQSLTARMENCLYCCDSSQFPKHLIVAIGAKVYLCLPNFRSLTEGHCLVVPLQHHRAATLLDEDIWEEIQVFRKSLVKMFEGMGLDCVFLETNISMKKQHHMVYECIPLPKEVGEMAPIYFKKAIMESDEEWSINKKLIDLSSKDIRRSVPRGLPYFSVDFGLQGGFAHVIEDQHKFPHYFGKEIIGGMLDLEPRLWRKGIRESFEDQRKKALQFAQWWKPYDFTKSKM